MPVERPGEAIHRWADAIPDLGHGFAADESALTAFCVTGENLLLALPPKPARDEDQQLLASIVFARTRQLRNRFMDLHAERVYEVLTAGFVRPRRLADLVMAAADRFPGLVPSPARLRDERQRSQADKDGWEIDQGIFFRAILRSPVAGAHLVEAMRFATPRARDVLAEFRDRGRIQLPSVRLELRGTAGHLTMTNGDRLNAEDDELLADLETAVDVALLAPEVRVGVLRGGVVTHPRHRGRRVFSAGINLTNLSDGKISFVEFILSREIGCLNKLVHGLRPDDDAQGCADLSVQKPWVAAVDSFAIGGGLQILLTVDWVIATDDAYFVLPAAQEGIVPGVANLRLARVVGARLARQMILSGRKVTAADPAGELLCDEVVPAAAMEAAIDAAVSRLDNPAVIANRRMLNVALDPPDTFRRYVAEFAGVQAERLYSDDLLSNLDRRRAAKRASR